MESQDTDYNVLTDINEDEEGINIHKCLIVYFWSKSELDNIYIVVIVWYTCSVIIIIIILLFLY